MSAALKQFMLAFLIAVLPLQGFAAIVTPICQQERAISAPDAAIHSHIGGQDYNHEASAPAHDHPLAAGDFGSDHCGTASAFAIPVKATAFPTASVAQRSPFFAIFVSGHIPEQPQRPPRAVLF